VAKAGAAGVNGKSAAGDGGGADEHATVLARCWEEFRRLNDLHFGGTLALREIRFSTRKQYGGYYRHSESLIVLSWSAYLDHGWEETLETLRHEIAHIVHQNHSKSFWELAYRLGCTRRYATAPKDRPHAYTRYTYECPACHTKFHRQRRIRRASCGKCDRKFNENFVLRLV
jgi:predicted SprT family Zn-dependent metalloprotease